MTSTMLKLKCPSCNERFIIHYKKYKRNIKNIKKLKNLNKSFSEKIREYVKHPEIIDKVFTKIHYEVEK